MEFRTDVMYTKSHEWLKDEGDFVTIGISDYAQDALGDLVFVNLPQEGDEVAVEEVFADVESVKAVSDIYSPVTGVVCAVNEELLDAPELINESAFDAWFIKVKDITEQGEFMNAEEYEAFVAEEE